MSHQELARIRALVNDPQASLKDLEDIEKTQYKPLLQRLINGKSPAELKELVIVFEDLANLMTKMGDLSGDLARYNDAALMHQYMLTILEENPTHVDDRKADLYAQLAELQRRLFSAIGGDRTKMLNVAEEANNYRAKLSQLRAKVQREIECPRMEPDKTRELFEVIANEMKDFLAMIYKDSEDQMSMPPPCAYAVIGLGSMALQQITPYSDLEFAILVENKDFRKNTDPKVREYFKNLSHLAHFKVIGLRETEIAFSKYEVNTSHLVHAGVNFDLGGKTPLGRIDKDKSYNLIKTVDWMLHYVYNKEDWVSHMDKNLPYILENVCYVYGEENLVTNYQAKVAAFLGSVNEADPSKRLNCEIRALKILEEGAVEFEYNRETIDGKLGKVAFKGDLDKLEPKLVDSEGFSYNVKQDIYRLTDRMIYNFGMYFNVTGTSGWDIIDKLCTANILNERAAVNLKRAVSFATMLRLKAYLHSRAQDEGMSIFPMQPDLALENFQLSVEDLSEDGDVFHYYYSALPLHQMLRTFCAKCQGMVDAEKHAFFREVDFYKNDILRKGLIHYRLSQYELAECCLKRVSDQVQGEEKRLVCLTLGDVYKKLSQSGKAIESYKFCVDYLEQSNNTLCLAIAHLKLGGAFIDDGQFNEGVKCVEAGLKLSATLNHSQLRATSLSYLGIAYGSLGEYARAENYFQESLKLKRELLDNKPHLDITFVLYNLACVCTHNANYANAIQHYDEILSIQRQFLGDEPHMDVAITLNNLAGVHQKLCQYVQSIECLEKSLFIQKVIFNGKPHSCLAKTLSHIGCSLNSIAKFSEAELHLKASLEMERLVNNGSAHPDVATVLNNLGMNYQNQAKFDQAIDCHEENLKILKVLYANKDHPYMAKAYINLGVAYSSKSDYAKAVVNFEESLRIMKMVYNTEVHSDVVATLNNIGHALIGMVRHKEAIDYFEKSLRIHKLIHKEAHEVQANLLNNLAICFLHLGDPEKALDYHQESLKIEEKIYSSYSHPSIAVSHLNMGMIYRKLGRVAEAINHYEISLQIQRSVFGGNPHPDMGVTLMNLGNAYTDIGDDHKAISYYEESLTIQTAVYQSENHPNILLVLSNLGLALASCGEFSRAFQAINRASIRYKGLELPLVLQNFVINISWRFARCYALDFTTIKMKIADYIFRGLDFTDSATHLDFAEPESSEEKRIENYKLAAIFLQKDQDGMEKRVYDKLTKLTGVSAENLDQWLRKESWFPLGNNTRLTKAIAEGNLQLVSTLVQLKCNVNEPYDESDGASPLYCALGFFGQPVNFDIVELLLNNGADPNQAMCDGDTPMHMAHYIGNSEAIQLLLAYGGDINVQNIDGKTPLHVLLAAKNVSSEVKMQLCEELGGFYDTKLMDGKGRTAKEYAAKHCPELSLIFED